MEKKKKYRKAVKVNKKSAISNENIPQSEPTENYQKVNYWRIFFVSIVLLIFFSSSVIMLFNKENKEDVVFNQTKKYLLDKLARDGPSAEIYKNLAEIYAEKDTKISYIYLKEAFNLLKLNQASNSELIKNREILKKLVEMAYQQNEPIENILKYSVLLYKSTSPSNPEYFEVLASIINLYNTTGNLQTSINLLKNLEQIYSENIQIKYLLCNQYYFEGDYNLAKNKIDYIISYKNKNKTSFSYLDVSLFFLVYTKFYSFDHVVNQMIPLFIRLSYSDLGSLIVFFLDKTDIDNYKKILSIISIYRPETRILINTNPYLNLEIGRKYWIKSQKSLAEIYFKKALSVSNSNPDIKKNIESYIYQIKSEYYNKETEKIKDKSAKKTMDIQKMIEEIK